MSQGKAVLKLHLLGGIRVSFEGGEPLRFSSRRAELTLAYLALNPQEHGREHLANFLWDDRTRRRGLSNLRSLLARLPEAVKPLLLATRSTIALDADRVWVDVREFEAALSQDFDPAAHEHAMQLYRGDFLEGVHIRESEGLNEWLYFTRERLWTQAIHGHIRLAEYHFHHRNYPPGLEHVRRVLKMDPLREDAHLLAMRLYARSGQVGEAIRQFQDCERIFREELDAAPSNRLVRLHDRLKHAGSAVVFEPPPQLTAFVGRSSELAAITQLLDEKETRLVTLVGTGGIGKTRLALEIADTVRGDYLNGASFVPLAPSDEPESIPRLVSARVGLEKMGDASIEAGLVRFLANREILIVLDNVEHLLPEAAQWVDKLIRAGPLVKVLATSRERLSIPYESVFHLEGLRYQAVDDLNEAVDLFAACARKHDQRFELTSGNIAQVKRICTDLQGLPLGIEFAAAWAHVLPINEIADQIRRGLSLLVARDDRAARHGSLAVVFDYSWKRLNETEQDALQRFSLFRGSFSIEAARKSAGANAHLLADLVDKSLVLSASQQDRYFLLDVFRRYVISLWQGDKPGYRKALDRFARYFAGWIRHEIGEQIETLSESTLSRIEQEEGNLRRALLGWLEAGGAQPDRLRYLIAGLYLYYSGRAFFNEGFVLYERLADRLDRSEASGDLTQARAMCFVRLGAFSISLGRMEAAGGYLEQGEALLDAGADRREQAFLLRQIGRLRYYEAQHPEAERALREAIGLSGKIEDEAGQGIALRLLGTVHNALGQYKAAVDSLDRSIAIHRSTGNRILQAASLNNLANSLCELGEYEQALEHYDECLALYRSLDNRYRIGLVLNNIATVQTVLGRYDRAVALLEECRELCREIGDEQGQGVALLNLGFNYLLSGDLAAARSNLEGCLQVFQSVDYTYMELLGLIFLGRVALGEDDYGEALGHLKEVVRRSDETTLAPLTLKALIYVAPIWDALGEPAMALAALQFIEKHELSNRETREEARAQLRNLKADSGRPSGAQREVLDKPLDLDSLVAAVAQTEWKP